VENLQKINLKARAKINLSLDVLRRREDGYHDVAMIMQQIDLYDKVTLEKTDGGIMLETDCYYLPVDRRNIAYLAAEKMIEKYAIDGGVKIALEKKIPVAAGLAGGSTDAAAVIKGMNKLYDLNLSMDEMMKLGVTIGADVPFCIKGGAAFAEGIGEKLRDIKGLENVWILLSKPAVSVSTKDVYGGLKVDEIPVHPDNEQMIQWIEDGDVHNVSENLVNVLENVTMALHPSIRDIKDKMKVYGASGVLMSGSGPTVFGIFYDHKRASKAVKNMKKYYKQSYLVRTYNGGKERV